MKRKTEALILPNLPKAPSSSSPLLSSGLSTSDCTTEEHHTEKHHEVQLPFLLLLFLFSVFPPSSSVCVSLAVSRESVWAQNGGCLSVCAVPVCSHLHGMHYTSVLCQIRQVTFTAQFCFVQHQHCLFSPLS